MTAQSTAETPVWTPRDRSIVYADDGDLWVRPVDDDRRPSMGGEAVRALEDEGAEHKVSVDGDMASRWRGDGKEIFFLSPEATMMAARVATRNGFKARSPSLCSPPASASGRRESRGSVFR